MRNYQQLKTTIWSLARAASLGIAMPYITIKQHTNTDKPLKGYTVLLKQPAIRYLAFEGGGAKGIAYIGVMESLQRRNMLNRIQALRAVRAVRFRQRFTVWVTVLCRSCELMMNTNMNEFQDIAPDAANMNWIKGWRMGIWILPLKPST